MAERRMFAKQIVQSDAFTGLSLAAQAVYLALGVAADDDGFVNAPLRTARGIGASGAELDELIAKKFLISFPNGVVLIKAWRINNYIQKDRYKRTNYDDLLDKVEIEQNGMYTLRKVQRNGTQED